MLWRYLANLSILGRPATVATPAPAEKASPSPAQPDRSLSTIPAPSSTTNKWSSGRPKIDTPKEMEKILPTPIPQAPPQHVPVAPQPVPTIPQPQPSQPSPQPQHAPQAPAVSADILNPMEQANMGSGAWGSGQVESSSAGNMKVPMHSASASMNMSSAPPPPAHTQAHAQAHTSPAIGSSGARTAESIEKSNAQDRGGYRERSAQAPSAREDRMGGHNNFASLNVDQASKMDNTGAAANTMAAQSHAALSYTETQTQQVQQQFSQMAIPSQPAAFNAQQYGAYAPASQQYTGYGQAFSGGYGQAQEGEDFNSRGAGLGDTSSYSLGADTAGAQRGGAMNYNKQHGKPGHQAPQQQGMGMTPSWQMNPAASYLASPMYGYPPQQVRSGLG